RSMTLLYGVLGPPMIERPARSPWPGRAGSFRLCVFQLRVSEGSAAARTPRERVESAAVSPDRSQELVHGCRARADRCSAHQHRLVVGDRVAPEARQHLFLEDRILAQLRAGALIGLC